MNRREFLAGAAAGVGAALLPLSDAVAATPAPPILPSAPGAGVMRLVGLPGKILFDESRIACAVRNVTRARPVTGPDGVRDLKVENGCVVEYRFFFMRLVGPVDLVRRFIASPDDRDTAALIPNGLELSMPGTGFLSGFPRPGFVVEHGYSVEAGGLMILDSLELFDSRFLPDAYYGASPLESVTAAAT